MKLDRVMTNKTKEGIYVLFVIECTTIDTPCRYHGGGHTWENELLTGAKLYRSWVSAKNVINVLRENNPHLEFCIRKAALGVGRVFN